jgi:hypothetical protein
MENRTSPSIVIPIVTKIVTTPLETPDNSPARLTQGSLKYHLRQQDISIGEDGEPETPKKILNLVRTKKPITSPEKPKKQVDCFYLKNHGYRKEKRTLQKPVEGAVKPRFQKYFGLPKRSTSPN